MEQTTRPPGKTTIDSDVLNSIARLTTLGVQGVSRLSPEPANVNRLFKKSGYEGVQIVVENNSVYADIYVVLMRDVDVREICRKIQSQVARAFSEMVGMDIGKINIHVEDVDYSED